MILGVSGSPRNHATEYVLRRALDQLNQAGYETTFWGVRGKKITPFMLVKLHNKTGNKSLFANKEPVYNNVRLAAEIPKAYSEV